jgi:hypothetical protein
MLNGMPLSIFYMIVVLYIEERVWLQIKRLHLLLTERESAMDVPENLEARRRIAFIANKNNQKIQGLFDYSRGSCALNVGSLN